MKNIDVIFSKVVLFWPFWFYWYNLIWYMIIYIVYKMIWHKNSGYKFRNIFHWPRIFCHVELVSELILFIFHFWFEFRIGSILNLILKGMSHRVSSPMTSILPRMKHYGFSHAISDILQFEISKSYTLALFQIKMSRIIRLNQKYCFPQSYFWSSMKLLTKNK